MNKLLLAIVLVLGVPAAALADDVRLDAGLEENFLQLPQLGLGDAESENEAEESEESESGAEDTGEEDSGGAGEE